MRFLVPIAVMLVPAAVFAQRAVPLRPGARHTTSSARSITVPNPLRVETDKPVVIGTLGPDGVFDPTLTPRSLDAGGALRHDLGGNEGKVFGLYGGVIRGLAGDAKGRFIVGPAGIATGRAELGTIEAVVRGSEDAASIAATALTGNVGLFGGTRTADGKVGNGLGTISVCLNDRVATAPPTDCWAQYSEFRRYPGAGITQTESNGLNGGNVVDMDPYRMFNHGATMTYWASAGRQEAAAFNHNLTLALGIAYNGARFRRGIVVGANALDPLFNEALSMGAPHGIAWYSGTQDVGTAFRVGWIGAERTEFRRLSAVSDGGYVTTYTRGGATGAASAPDRAVIAQTRYQMQLAGKDILAAETLATRQGGGGAYQIRIKSGDGSIAGLAIGTTADGAVTPVGAVGTLGAEGKAWNTAFLGKLRLGDLGVFADNKRALNAGLAKGEVYRTATGQLMVVY